jgi:hypothetical protein
LRQRAIQNNLQDQSINQSTNKSAPRATTAMQNRQASSGWAKNALKILPSKWLGSGIGSK